MEDLSDAIFDFLDEICPLITSAKKSSTSQMSGGPSCSFSEEKVLSALNEAASWAESLVKEGKLYLVICTYYSGKSSYNGERGRVYTKTGIKP
jgi:hypothetical protein